MTVPAFNFNGETLRTWMLDTETSIADKQASHANLAALAALALIADRLPYANGSGTLALTTLSAFARTILDDADAAAARTTLAAAPLDSPAFTGTPTVPTATAGTNTTQSASTAFVQAAIAALINSAPGALDTLDELAAAFGDDPNFAATMTNALANKQNLHANLTALAGLSLVADRLPYSTGAGALALTTLSSFARTLLDDADASTARATLGIGITNTTTPGLAEVALLSEVNAGTDAFRHVCPDALAGSYAGTKEMCAGIFDSDQSVAVGDGKFMIAIPSSINGMNIVEVVASVYTQGVTGSTTIQVRRCRAGTNVDVLTSALSIGAVYTATSTAINTSNDDLATGDVLFIDVDTIHTTAPLGLSVVISARLP